MWAHLSSDDILGDSLLKTDAAALASTYARHFCSGVCP
jgi:hypothetical protein